MKKIPKFFEIIILLLVGITAVLWLYEKSGTAKICFLFLLIYMFFRFYKRDDNDGGAQ